MKFWLSIFFGIMLVGGCASPYCRPERIADPLGKMVVQQVGDGIRDTAANFRSLGAFLAEDYETSGARLRFALKNSLLYDSWNGSNVSNLGIFKMISSQMRQGAQDTWENLHSLASGFCLCRD